VIVITIESKKTAACNNFLAIIINNYNNPTRKIWSPLSLCQYKVPPLTGDLITAFGGKRLLLTKEDEGMNKEELLNEVAKTTCTKAEAGKALDAVLGAIKKALKKGDKVTLVGFGTFSVSKRSARTGRNPQTGAAIKIAARKVPKFTAGKALKDAVK